MIFKMIKISSWSKEMQMHLGQRRNSHRSCYIKVGVLKNFVIFTRNHLCWSLFFIKLQAFGLHFINTSAFLWILRNFKNNYFEDHPAYDCFWLGIQTAFVFSFWKNVFYPNQTFLRIDFYFLLEVLMKY